MNRILFLGLFATLSVFASRYQEAPTDSCSYEAVNGKIVLVCNGAYPPHPPNAPKNCEYKTVCENLGTNCHNELVCSGN